LPLHSLPESHRPGMLWSMAERRLTVARAPLLALACGCRGATSSGADAGEREARALRAAIPQPDGSGNASETGADAGAADGGASAGWAADGGVAGGGLAARMSWDTWLAGASCLPMTSGCRRLPARWCVADMLRESNVRLEIEQELRRLHGELPRLVGPDGNPWPHTILSAPRDVAVLGWQVIDSPHMNRMERAQLWLALESVNGGPAWVLVDVFRKPGVPPVDHWARLQGPPGYRPELTPAPFLMVYETRPRASDWRRWDTLDTFIVEQEACTAGSARAFGTDTSDGGQRRAP
jgi:hypothetical protein